MKKIPEEYRKYLYLGLTAVLAVWVFCICFVVAYHFRKDTATTETSTDISTVTISSEVSSTETTESTTTTESTSTSAEPTATVTIDGNNATTSGEYSIPSWAAESLSAAESYAEKEATRVAVPSGKAEIVKTYVDAVNKVKNTSDFTMKKGSEMEMTIDSVTGGDYIKNIVQKYIDSASYDPITYNFKNGNDSASGKSPNAEIPPAGAIASLDPEDVKSAAVKDNGNNRFTVTIELGKDTQTLEEKPKVYSSCMEVLDVNSLGLASATKIDTLNVSYSSGKIVATIDSAGRLVSMTHTLNVEKGAGSGKVTLISVTVEMHGTYRQTYSFSYS